jgi:xanthine dehydrogenase iron-sulfur cluster and FAD-binding subunit A
MFLALGASVTLLDAAGSTRELALPDLYLRYKKLAKAADEQVIDISFPAPLASDFFHFEKVDLFLNKKSDIFQAIFGARNGRCSKNPRIRAHTRHEAVCESRM